MIGKIITLFRKHYDILVYLIFGVLTTLVNFLAYFPCYNYLGLSAVVSNVIAWAAAVAFAYLTNKPFVFRSHDWSAGTVIPELMKFVGCRITSGAAESVIIWIAVDVLRGNGNFWKVVTSVLVVVLNYVGSKLIVFRK